MVNVLHDHTVFEDRLKFAGINLIVDATYSMTIGR